jgi:hypothetical protein
MTPEARLIEGLLRISTKDGEDVNFTLNTAQRRLDDGLTGRDLVPKARQEGVSSYVLAFFLIACLTYRNTRAVVISHDRESTQRLLNRVTYYIENIRSPSPVIKNMSKNEITFPKTNSMFYLGTAGSRKFGRGDTITHLHCSEYAFWPDPKGIMVGLLQAVPMSGMIIIESTGNGFNDYYRRCMKAEAGQSLWTNHFLPWHTFPEYTMKLSEKESEYVMGNLSDDWEEPELVANLGLTAGQIAWRRMKLDELEYDMNSFKQEYPSTIDECFQMSSESIFTTVNYAPTDRWDKDGPNFWRLEGHPNPALTYVIGGDPAAGVGKDSSAAEVYCVETAEQVAEYCSDRIDPEAFGHKMAELGKMFNDAYIVIEQNNHGILTLATLDKVYPSGLVHRDESLSTTSEERQLFGLGYRTTQRNKPLMIGNLRTKLIREWTIHSPLLRTQLSTYIEDEHGKLGAQDGCYDDLVMASACAAAGYNRAAITASAKAMVQAGHTDNPFLLENIIKEMHSRGRAFPVRPQNEGWN